MIEYPLVGEQKKGNLAYMREYKFRINKQLALLGYRYEEGTMVLELLALGSHENFIEMLRNQLEEKRSILSRDDF